MKFKYLILLILMLGSYNVGNSQGFAGSNSWLFSTSDLPTPPANAYVYSPLQQQSPNCPTSQNSAYNSSANTTACWGSNSKDATGSAGQGVFAPTVVTFGNTSPALSGSGSMMFGVTNPKTVTPTATGNSGDSTIIVSSISGLGTNFKASGTGIGNGAQIAKTWDGVSTTIPLTVPNSGNVTGTVTFSFVANSLFPNHLPVTLTPTIPGPATTGTLTVSAGTVKINNDNTITFTNATASDTAYALTAMQIYVDGALYYSDANTNGPGPVGQQGAPYSPLTYTTGALSDGSHSISVKAFDTNNTSSLVSFTVNLGGANISTVGNLLDDFYYWIPANEPMEAFEVDPDIFNYNTHIPGCSGTSCSTHMEASMQCDVYSGSNAPGQWRFWDTEHDTWIRQDGSKSGTTGTSYSCTNAMTAGVWHHYQLYATFNVISEIYAYQTLVIDGKTLFKNLNLAYNGLVTNYGTSTNFISVQNQIDLDLFSSQTTPTVIYYDNYKLTAW